MRNKDAAFLYLGHGSVGVAVPGDERGSHMATDNARRFRWLRRLHAQLGQYWGSKPMSIVGCMQGAAQIPKRQAAF